MKHIFVVNPCAGRHDSGDDIAAAIDITGIDADTYCTRAPRDATRFVDQWCREHPGEAVRFHACGGDGTLNEVASGAIGHPGAEVSCYPCGSGNDYVKCWPDADFTDIAALAGATAVPVDMLRVTGDCGERYAVNVLNFGFEAEVCRTMEIVRRWPLFGGRAAYITGIAHCLLHSRHNPCRITLDGEAWHSGDLLLASAANGRYVGGGYLCAPRAVPYDGWLEALAVDSISVARFIKLIGFYKRGEHLDRPEMHDVVHHRRVRRMTFDSDREFSIVLDGELLRGRHFEAEIIPQAIRFAVPQKPNK